jgi:hypothetical protein
MKNLKDPIGKRSRNIPACVSTNCARCVYVCAYGLIYPARKANAPLWPVWFCHVINGTIFGKKLLNIKCVILFYLQLLSETRLILGTVQRDIVINVQTSSRKVPVILVGF